PALDRQHRFVLVGGVEPEFRSAVGGAHHLPAIGGRFGLMHDDGGGGALARGFLEFVSPATIIGHGAALEEFRIGLGVFVAGVVDQDDDRFSFHIDAGIV